MGLHVANLGRLSISLKTWMLSIKIPPYLGIYGLGIWGCIHPHLQSIPGNLTPKVPTRSLPLPLVSPNIPTQLPSPTCGTTLTGLLLRSLN